MLYHPIISQRFYHSIPVLLVLGMVVGLYYCYLFGFLFLVDVSVSMFPCILFHFTACLMTWAYVMSVLTDPGGVPESFYEMASERELLTEHDYNKGDYNAAKISVCNKCHKTRPPRTHHCSMCGRCVLRMDHHCPWIGNCVGHGNHKFFVQFVTYGAITCFNMGISCAATLESLRFRDNPQGQIGTVTGFAIGLTLVSLTFYQLYFILNNITTIEAKKQEKFNVFDTLSKKKNFQQIFGKTFLSWVLPIRSTEETNGVIYSLRIRNCDGNVIVLKDKLLL